jgi:DNA repair protein RecO
MYHAYHSKAFVIGSRPIGAGNKAVLFFTKNLGLVWALAQSAREERSQLRAHLVDFSYGTYTFIRGKDTWRVTGADGAYNLFFSVAESPRAVRLTARLFSLVRRLVNGEDPNPYLFTTLATAVSLAQEHANDDAVLANLEVVSVLRVLASLGYIGDSPSLRSFVDADSVSLALCTDIADVRADALKAIQRAFSVADL